MREAGPGVKDEPRLEVEDDRLQAIVDTIVEVVHPQEVILFGSRATGAARPDSDYDFLVVVPDVQNERDLSSRIYRALMTRRLGVAVDVVVVSEHVLARNRHNPFLIYHQALQEGRVVHGHPASG